MLTFFPVTEKRKNTQTMRRRRITVMPSSLNHSATSEQKQITFQSHFDCRR